MRGNARASRSSSLSRRLGRHLSHRGYRRRRRPASGSAVSSGGSGVGLSRADRGRRRWAGWRGPEPPPRIIAAVRCCSGCCCFAPAALLCEMMSTSGMSRRWGGVEPSGRRAGREEQVVTEPEVLLRIAAVRCSVLGCSLGWSSSCPPLFICMQICAKPAARPGESLRHGMVGGGAGARGVAGVERGAVAEELEQSLRIAKVIAVPPCSSDHAALAAALRGRSGLGVGVSRAAHGRSEAGAEPSRGAAYSHRPLAACRRRCGAVHRRSMPPIVFGCGRRCSRPGAAARRLGG